MSDTVDALRRNFMRTAAAYDVSARMRYRKESVLGASRAVLRGISFLKGKGGLIAVDRRGNVAMPFNTPGMYRAWVSSGGRMSVAVS